MAERMKGQVERVVFQNPENQWTVARLVVREHPDPVTIVGALPISAPGEQVEVTGEWIEHPRFGRQLSVQSCRIIPPSTADGIRRYLGSGSIRGIGPAMAARLVDAFGEQTLEVMENEIERLKQVEGIGDKKLGMIAQSWNEHREMRDLMVFLQSHGVTPGLAVKVYRQYGGRALDVVRNNPYTLVMDIFGVGFVTADKLAQNIGYDRESVLRAEAGVLYFLQRNSERGHVCCPQDTLIEETGKLLDVSRDIVERGLRGVMDRGQVASEEYEGTVYVYFRLHIVAEKGIAKHLAALIQSGRAASAFDWDKIIQKIEERLGLQLDDNQREAVKGALANKVMVITGGPGTGKTTIIRAIIELMNRRGQTVLLAAPTGRAAKRLGEATAREARTIHRMLEYNPVEGGFKRGYDNPLSADAVIIDEASMVDSLLMYHLVRAIPLDASLVLVGDVDQLPSVGPGSVLREIIGSSVAPVARLTKIFRQAEESRIIVNAHRINEGRFPITENPGPQNLLDFYFLEQEDPDKALNLILELCLRRIPERFGFNPVHDIQVITPMNRGTVGVTNLNLVLQEALNPGEGGITRGEKVFRVGDKVMQLKNDYDKEVFNGDIGRILSLDTEDQTMKVEFDQGPVGYLFSELDELTLAYAISVHKSQGSEYPAVVLPLLTQHYMMLQRNLVYTAVTRGKKLVIIVGSKKALSMAIRNDKPLERHSLLKERLRNEFKGHGERILDLDDL